MDGKGPADADIRLAECSGQFRNAHLGDGHFHSSASYALEGQSMLKTKSTYYTNPNPGILGLYNR